MNLLVTGASGFIAENFIKYSIKKNTKVIAISRKKRKLSKKDETKKGKKVGNQNRYRVPSFANYTLY